MNSLQWFIKNVCLIKNWVAFYRGSLHLKLRNGLVVDLPTRHDIPILHEIFTDKVYGALVTHSAKPVIVDIGANTGLFTLFALHRYPHALVHCYEPSSANRAFLIENIIQNGYTARVWGEAVSDMPGKVSLYISSGGDSGHNTLVKENVAQSISSIEEVDAVTLDSILASLPTCEVVKIDIEGMEGPVISASKLLKNIPQVLVEPEFEYLLD